MLMRWMLPAMEIGELKRNHIWRGCADMSWGLRWGEVSPTVFARLPRHFNNTIKLNKLNTRDDAPFHRKLVFQIENNYLVHKTRQLRRMSFSLSHTMLRTNKVAASTSQFHLLFVFCLQFLCVRMLACCLPLFAFASSTFQKCESILCGSGSIWALFMLLWIGCIGRWMRDEHFIFIFWGFEKKSIAE